MLNIQYQGRVATVDVRENIRRGEHPKAEILRFVQEAAPGTVIQIHLPIRAEPLAQGLKSLGLNTTFEELEPGHYRLMCVII